MNKIKIIDRKAAGMCQKTMGMSFVIFKKNDEDLYRIMEHKEFNAKYKVDD